MSNSIDSGKADVFISYCGEDSDVALTIANELTRWGVKIWIDCLEIRPGQSISKAIDDGLINSKFATPVFSKAYFGRYWTEEELRGMRSLHGRLNRVVPVWHGIDETFVQSKSPILSDTKAIIFNPKKPAAASIELCSIVNEAVYAQQTMPKIKTVSIDKLEFGPLQREQLTEAETSRAQLIQVALADGFDMSLLETIKNFCRDMSPSAEFIFWEITAACYLKAKRISSFSSVECEQIFGAVFSLLHGELPDRESFSDSQIVALHEIVKSTRETVANPPVFDVQQLK